MGARPRPLSITPSQGGRLVTVGSLGGVGEYNYAAKTNFRRKELNLEGRREGWNIFHPHVADDDPNVQGSPSHPDGAGKITLVAECVRPNQDKAIFAASQTAVYKFNGTSWTKVIDGLSVAGRRWQVIPINGYLVFNNDADLPFTVRVEEDVATPIWELRENGIAHVGIIEEENGILLCFDVTEIADASLVTVMNSGSPYGLVDPGICNRIVFRTIWGEIGDPRSWAPRFDVTLNASTNVITLPFPSKAFVAGVTRVAIINGGPNDGILGGQTGYEDGILVTGVAGNTVTLEIPTDAGLSYPRMGEIVRWDDQSTIAGFRDLQDDASGVRAVRKLLDRLIIYQAGGTISRCTFQGSVDAPFAFIKIIGTEFIPLWHDAVAEINGDYHLYPGEGNDFFMFDGVNQPMVHKVCHDSRKSFFSGITTLSDVFAFNNPITEEVWFCRPGKTYAYDTLFSTVSEIDAEFNSAAYIRKPGADDRWTIFSIGANVFVYGLVTTAALPFVTYLRNGAAAGGQLKGGLAFWGDRTNEKDITEYVIEMQTGNGTPALQFKLYSCTKEQDNPALLCTVALPCATGYLVPLYFRDRYFQDEINILEATDIEIAFAARTFTRAPIDSGSLTQARSP